TDAAVDRVLALFERRRTGGHDAEFRAVVEEELEVQIPLPRVLDLVEEKIGRAGARQDPFVVDAEDLLDAQQLEHRMIEAEVKDASRIDLPGQQAVDELVEHRRLAHPPRTRDQDAAP